MMIISDRARRDRLPIRGRALRFVLVDLLMTAGQVMTVAELAAALADHGHTLDGRPSKIISDALRWEVRRGRVVRPGRGRYHYVSAPPTTARRIRLFAARCRTWIVAVRRNERPPPTPCDPRRHVSSHPCRPHHPPWCDLRWLWVT